MKVKHCFFLFLLVLASGSFFLALSVSPYFKSSLKSSNKDGTVPKSASRSNERATNAKPLVDIASSTNVKPLVDVASSSASSAKSAASSTVASPVVEPSLDSAAPSEPASDLTAQLAQCRSELQSFKSSVVVKDDSKDDLRAQLQEAQLKLKASEEEVQALLAQKALNAHVDTGKARDGEVDTGKTRDGEVNAGNKCRIFERESNLCKTELRNTHAKVLRSHARVFHLASNSLSAVHGAARHCVLVFGSGHRKCFC
jgi:hypothetical protein